MRTLEEQERRSQKRTEDAKTVKVQRLAELLRPVWASAASVVADHLGYSATPGLAGSA